MKLSRVVPAVAIAVVAPAFADEAAGPKVGDAAPTFEVEDVTGPNKGKDLCYV